MTLLGGVLPSLEKIWPSRQLTRLASACPAADIGLLGFREPSARFTLKSETDQQSPETIAAQLGEEKPRLTIIEDRWLGRAATALEAKTQKGLPPVAGCVAAYNVMRGCPLRFRVYATGGAGPCVLPAEFACDPKVPATDPQKSGKCD